MASANHNFLSPKDTPYVSTWFPALGSVQKNSQHLRSWRSVASTGEGRKSCPVFLKIQFEQPPCCGRSTDPCSRSEY